MLIVTETLSRIEKLRLIEQVWDELIQGQADIESPAWHADALQKAERAIANNDAGFIDWNQAKEQLRQGGA